MCGHNDLGDEFTIVNPLITAVLGINWAFLVEAYDVTSVLRLAGGNCVKDAELVDLVDAGEVDGAAEGGHVFDPIKSYTAVLWRCILFLFFI